MEIDGKVISILPEEKGQGKNGEWRKMAFVIETQAKFPKKVCITVWGDRIDEFALQQALAKVGPVSVGIDAAHVAFMFYSHGVYYNPKCGKF